MPRHTDGGGTDARNLCPGESADRYRRLHQGLARTGRRSEVPSQSRSRAVIRHGGRAGREGAGQESTQGLSALHLMRCRRGRSEPQRPVEPESVRGEQIAGMTAVRVDPSSQCRMRTPDEHRTSGHPDQSQPEPWQEHGPYAGGCCADHPLHAGRHTGRSSCQLVSHGRFQRLDERIPAVALDQGALHHLRRISAGSEMSAFPSAVGSSGSGSRGRGDRAGIARLLAARQPLCTRQGSRRSPHRGSRPCRAAEESWTPRPYNRRRLPERRAEVPGRASGSPPPHDASRLGKSSSASGPERSFVDNGRVASCPDTCWRRLSRERSTISSREPTFGNGGTVPLRRPLYEAFVSGGGCATPPTSWAGTHTRRLRTWPEAAVLNLGDQSSARIWHAELITRHIKAQVADLGLHHGAGDENRTRALSLGSLGSTGSMSR